MPKVDYDKLQDALEEIKKVCEIQEEGCVGCPLGGQDGVCRLSICPRGWKPKHPEVDVFRVLA